MENSDNKNHKADNQLARFQKIWDRLFLRIALLIFIIFSFLGITQIIRGKIEFWIGLLLIIVISISLFFTYIFLPILILFIMAWFSELYINESFGYNTKKISNKVIIIFKVILATVIVWGIPYIVWKLTE